MTRNSTSTGFLINKSTTEINQGQNVKEYSYLSIVYKLINQNITTLFIFNKQRGFNSN